MFDTSPFHDLLGFLTPTIMQIYVVLMFLAVVGGTIIDTIHKKSAEYFFQNAQEAQQSARRTVSSGEKVSIAISTVANEVLTSSEFANPQRRKSHLLTMYGFIIFVVTTVTMIFGYPTPAEATPAMLVILWHIGALMVCGGGYWFWFFIRCDVVSEGKPWHKLVRADLFIVSLLLTTTFALIWSITQGAGALNTLFFTISHVLSHLSSGRGSPSPRLPVARHRALQQVPMSAYGLAVEDVKPGAADQHDTKPGDGVRPFVPE